MKRLTLLITLLFVMIGTNFAQNKVVLGVVLSQEDNQPIIGASVFLPGNPKAGSVTDIDGKFKITVPKDAKTLRFSYIGMETVDLPISSNMKVVLKADSKLLDQAVVVGMTTVDKRLFTGASTKVGGEKSKLDGVPDAARALEGKAAGVSVQNVSGTFGTAPKIRVRGATSIYGASKPLWVVDGVVLDDVVNLGPDDLASGDANTLISNAIAGLNPDDIQSFEVLKDGSATSIYGARAMAGVIAITTKKGRAGYSKISYTGEYTYRLIPRYSDYNIMNSQEQMGVYRELEEKGWLNLAQVANSPTTGEYGKMYDLINKGLLRNDEESKNAYLRKAEMRNTNWFNELFNHSVMNSHSVSITSGDNKSQYYASISALVDPGWTRQSKVNRYTANLNASYKIFPKLTLNMIASASYRSQRAPGTVNGSTDAVTGVVARDFDINPFSYSMNTSRTLDPDVFYTRSYSPFNIKHELDNNYMNLTVFDQKYQAELSFKPIKGLTLSVLGDVKMNTSENQYIIKESSNFAMAYRAMQTTVIRESNPYLYKDPDNLLDLPISVMPEYTGFFNPSTHKLKGWDIRGTLQYSSQIGQNHIINLFSGAEANATDREAYGFDGPGIMYEQGNTIDFNYKFYKQMKEKGRVPFDLTNSRYRNIAFFGNLTYSFKQRYTINGTVRYEGTNKMGKSRKARWLPTWNISGSWDAGSEPFMQGISNYLSALKFKASYSLTADKGPDWVNNSTVIYTSGIRWRFPSSQQSLVYNVARPANTELTYEKKHEFNFGLEAGFFNNRINLVFDIYKRNNYDLIAPKVTQGLGGNPVQYANTATLKSNGLEFSISTTNIKTSNFSWITDFVYSYSKSIVTDLYSDSRMIDMISGYGFAKKDYPVRSLFSIPFNGLNQKGNPTFIIDNKGTVTTSQIDFQQRKDLEFLKYSGNMDPTNFGSLGNTFKYKNLEFNVFLTYSFGNVIRLDNVFSTYYDDLTVSPREMNKRFINPGDEKATNIPSIVSKRDLQSNGNLRLGYNAYNFSDVRVAKGDFVRLKEVSLTYNLPSKWVNKLKMSNLSFKIQATNLCLLYSDSKLQGADPEFFNMGGVATPLPRQITATLRIGI